MDRAKALIIAIDGPAGSGKSTVSKMIAKRLGILYVDTGAMYRALTVKAMRNHVGLEDEPSLILLARSSKIDLREKDRALRVFIDGEDVTEAIRTTEVTSNIKYIARVPGVRHEMVSLQRSVAERAGAVLEGRDIGTVVFPDADYKFYLDADAEERARRRHKELIAAGYKVKFEEIKEDVLSRDRSDMTRKAGPLKKATDAIEIDATDLSINEVVEKIIGFIT